MPAYLVRFRPGFPDGRVLPLVERIVTVDRGHRGIRPDLIAGIEEALTNWGRNLGWEWVEIDEVRYLGGAMHLSTLPVV